MSFTEHYLSNQNSFKPFVEKHGNDLPDMFIESLAEILNQSNNEEIFLKLDNLAFYIFAELSGRAFGEPIKMKLNKNIEEFQQLVYHFNAHHSLNIPFKEVEPIIRLFIKELKHNLSQNIHSFSLTKYKVSAEKYAFLLNEYGSKPENSRNYTEFLNGAL